DVISDHAGICFEMSAGARLQSSRLSRWRATSSVPCLNRVLFQYGSKSKSSLIAAANVLYASARMSASVKAQLNRSLVLPCALAVPADPSASADAPASNERRLIWMAMRNPSLGLSRSRSRDAPERHLLRWAKYKAIGNSHFI